jgi:hypothetical protein
LNHANASPSTPAATDRAEYAAPRAFRCRIAGHTDRIACLAGRPSANRIGRAYGLSKASLLDIENAEQESRKTRLNPNDNNAKTRGDKSGYQRVSQAAEADLGPFKQRADEQNRAAQNE